MTFVNAQQTRVLIGDFNFTPVTAQASTDITVEMLDHTTLNDTAKVFIPGLDTSTFSLSGWMDTSGSADAHLDQLNDLKALGATEALTYAPRGFTRGNEVLLAAVEAASFQTGTQVGDKNTYALECQTSGPTESGVSLVDIGSVTGTTNGTGVDLTTVSTTAGAVAHLHVTAYSGLTNVVFTVADSADNASFATIGTFTTVTGITSQRLAINGTIRRYVRYVATVTGTGSVTFNVSFVRR